MQRKKLFPALLLMLSTVACSPATMADTTASAGSSLRYVWVQTYNLSMVFWRSAANLVPTLGFFAILVAGIFVAILFSTEGGKGAFWTIAVITLMIASYGAYSSWHSIVTRAPVEVTAAADASSQGGLDAKKNEVSMRYAELLNYQFTAMLPDATTDVTTDSSVVKVCVYGYDAPSNCAPFEHVYDVDPYDVCIGWDKDGACDLHTTEYHHKHDPDVTYLIRYAGVSNLPDIYATSLTGLNPDPANKDHPLMYFSDWMLPPNYNDIWYSIMPWDHKKYDPALYTPPVDWVAYQKYEVAGQPIGATSWHQYSNPLLATANAGFVGDPATIAKLQAANMLLTPRDLYSPTGGPTKTYFDFVYPLGCLA